MLLQGNLPLEFKESGTLHGRFFGGEFEIGKRAFEKKKRKEIGEFSFLETNLGLGG